CLEPHHNLLRSALTIAQAYCIYESCQASSPTPCAATTTGASSSPIAISTAILASASCVISAPPTNSSSSSPKLRDGPWPLCAEGRDFGATAALWDLARQLDLLRSIDAQAPKRKQGPSVGEYLLLATLNRALAPTSKRQLAAWYRNTILVRLLPLPPAALRSQRFWDHLHALDAAKLARIEEDLTRRLVEE